MTALVTRTIIAATYERVSTRMQGLTGFGLDAQHKDAATFAREHDWTLPDHLRFRDGEDRNASGADWDLPGLNACLDAAKRRDFQVLIVPDPDRFARNIVKALVLEEQLRTYDVRVIYIRMPLEDTSEGRLVPTMVHSISEYEREKTTFRTARGRREKAERGLVVGTGVAPYGYRYRLDARGKQSHLVIDDDRADIVRRIFRDAMHLSIQHICDRLNADGIPTMRAGASGAGWVVATIYGILDNQTYLGRNPYGRRAGKARRPVHDQARWLFSPVPPIVTQDEWDAAHAALARRRITRSARTPATAAAFQLRSALVCGHCGGSLRCEPNGHGDWRYYACLRNRPRWAETRGRPVCPLPGVPAAPLERVAWDDVVATLLDPDKLRAGLAAARAEYAAANSHRAEQLAILERDIATARARLSRIIDEQLEAPSHTERARLLSEKATQVEAEIARMQAEHAALSTAPHRGLSDQQAFSLERFAAEVRAGLTDASPDERRGLFELLQLRGTVRLDPNDGIRLARAHRFNIQWTSVIGLRGHDQKFVNIQTIVVGQPSPPARASTE